MQQQDPTSSPRPFSLFDTDKRSNPYHNENLSTLISNPPVEVIQLPVELVFHLLFSTA